MARDVEFKHVRVCVTAMSAQKGYVARDYAKAAKRGYSGVLTRISIGADGLTNLVDICEGTNVADLTYYYGRKRLTNDFHGLGAFLIMNEEFMNKTLNGKSGPLWQPSN